MIIILIALLSGSASARALPGSQSSPSPLVEFYPASPSAPGLDALLAGDPGAGYLVYYLPDPAPGLPRLVVRLSRETASSPALAEVFDTPSGASQVPVSIASGQVVFLESLQPAVTLTSPAGWWVRQGLPNYNLEVQVNGPVYAMWGAGYDPISGPQGWAAEIRPGQAAVQVQVRDTDEDGFPDWELRQLLPAFPGQGYYRANYAERRCPSPLQRDPGVFAPWPFVASSGGFEQAMGVFRPPLVVDWQTGRLTHFSELVTVRYQNCAYALYTISPLTLGEYNRTDFEAPFAFYDLSGVGVGYPNLLLRTEHFPPSSPWLPLANQEYASIRYSWRAAVGDGRWDYKVEVFGFHPYDFQTPLADGITWIDAPAYDQFPAWVVERPWPVVTFIDTEGSGYRSSEGIYEWSPLQLGQAFLHGNESQPDPGAFQDIPQGLRGEYRLDRERQPELYLSPLDNRLHLLGAVRGLWNLGEQGYLVEVNADRDLYLDGWVRLRLGQEAGSCLQDASFAGCLVEEALFAPGEYLLYANPSGVVLRKAGYSAALFSILPPTDNRSWLDFKEKVGEGTFDRRDPGNLSSWLEAFPGDTIALQGASLSDLKISETGFTFTLSLSPGYAASGEGAAPFQGLPAGRYHVEYALGQFHLRPFRPPQVEFAAAGLDFAFAAPLARQPVRLTARLRNLGDAPASLSAALWTSLPGQAAQLVSEQPLSLPARQDQSLAFLWTPLVPGDYTLEIRLGGEGLPEGGLSAPAALHVAPAGQPSLEQAWLLTRPAAPWLAGIQVCGLSLGAAFLALYLLRRQPRKADQDR